MLGSAELHIIGGLKLNKLIVLLFFMCYSVNVKSGDADFQGAAVFVS
jgi:hypothetical protein